MSILPDKVYKARFNTERSRLKYFYSLLNDPLMFKEYDYFLPSLKLSKLSQ